MTISQFKTLIAISECGSFKEAAKQVCITHAAVGQQMKRLEYIMDVTLFDRTQKTPRLNQLGKALVPKAKAVVTSYETILDNLIGEPQMIGELTLGAVPSTIRGLIPKSVKRLVDAYSDLHIRVVPDLSYNLLERVEQGTLDAAVISEPKRIPTNLNWTPVVQEEIVLLAAKEITDTDPMHILATNPFIRHTRKAAVGQMVDEWLSLNKIEVRDTMEMESLENLASMVDHNLGVSIGPNICIPDPIFLNLQKISLGPNAMHRTLGVITRVDCSKIQLVHRLTEQIKLTLGNHSTSAS